MKEFPHLKRLSFEYTGIQDDDLAQLAPLASRIEKLYIKELWLGDSFRGDGIKHLSGWPRLKNLTVYSSQLSGDCDFEILLKLPALESFDVGTGQLSKGAFKSIAACPQLKQLSLFECMFESTSLTHLRSSASLESLLLYCTTGDPSPTTNDDGTVSTKEGLRFYPDYGRNEPEGMSKVMKKDQAIEKWAKSALPKVKVGFRH